MMKFVFRTCVGGTLLLGLGGFDQAPDEFILGDWKCEIQSDQGQITAYGSYLPDGISKATTLTSVSGKTPDGQAVEVQMGLEVTATWQFEGLVLTEKVTSARVPSYSVNGNPAPNLAAIEKALQEQIKDKVEVQDIEILSPESFRTTSRSEDGGVGVCTRM